MCVYGRQCLEVHEELFQEHVMQRVSKLTLFDFQDEGT
jgi:hypothetical protein